MKESDGLRRQLFSCENLSAGSFDREIAEKIEAEVGRKILISGSGGSAGAQGAASSSARSEEAREKLEKDLRKKLAGVKIPDPRTEKDGKRETEMDICDLVDEMVDACSLQKKENQNLGDLGKDVSRKTRVSSCSIGSSAEESVINSR